MSASSGRGPYGPPPPPSPGGAYPPPPGYGGARRRASMYGAPPPSRPDRGRWIKRYGPYIGLALVVLVSGVLAYILFTLRDVPDPAKEPALFRTVTVYDRKGRVIERRNTDHQFYVKLTLAEMGDMVKYATLAAEDRDFYQHPALDFGRTASAAASDVLRRGSLQGGSTITQQLVKISVNLTQRSVFRKMQEATLAFGLESQYSKDQVLEMYLNRVFYGHNAYGIGAASRVYFGTGKQPKDLSAGQAAFLASLINGPSYFDPQVNYEGAKQRQLYVLDGMAKKGWLTRAQADQAGQEDIKAQLKYDSSFFKSQAPHFVSYVMRVVEQQVDPSALQGGLNIYTTLDLDIQALAQKAVTTGVASARLKSGGVNNADLLAANPTTGEVLAYVGSADYGNDNIGGQFDVIQSRRQPGSSFKPYVFGTALKDRKITTATTVHDVPTDFGGGYKPHDYDDKFMGDMTARKSLVESRNVTAVEVARLEGIDNVIKQAHAQGIRTELKQELGTAIGGSEVTMWEHLQGYQVFANQGTLVPLLSVTRVTADGQDVPLYEQKPGQQPNIAHPMTQAEAYLVTDILKGYNQRWNLGWKRTMSGKSGTTGGAGPASQRDAWMMAYNPDIVVGAWAGNTGADGKGKGITAFGTSVGQTILASFINGLPASMSGTYKRPDGIVTGAGCPGSGTSTEVFLAGTQNGIDCPTPTPTTPTPSIRPTPTRTPSPSPSGGQISPSPGT